MSPRSAQSNAHWPPLPLAEWSDTLATLHMWTQIVGKTRLALAPMENHWWQIALYLTPRGLTTSAMPCGERSISVDFDFVAHALDIQSSDGRAYRLELRPRSVADFHLEYMEALRLLDVPCTITPTPVEVETATPFADDHAHASYDAEAVGRWWRITANTDRVLKRFRGRFVGKQSPSHFFWGAFDLAATRFSGRPAPPHPGGVPNCPDRVMTEAYSHEVSSCGFWPGGGPLDGPAFYAYAYPEPPGYAAHPVLPGEARYDGGLREFILPYETVRLAAQPEEMLLEFLQSTYEAAAELGRWDRAALERPPADWP